MTTLITISKFSTFVLTNKLSCVFVNKREKKVYIDYTDSTYDDICYSSFKKLLKMLKKTELYYIASFKTPTFVNLHKIVQCYIDDDNSIVIIFDGLDDEVTINFKSSKNAEKALYKLRRATEKKINCHNNLLNEIREMMYFHPPCDGGTGYQNSLKEFGNLQ